MCSFLHIHLEDGERHPQPYSGEYYWLGPDLTQNTRGRCILILSVFLIITVTVKPSVQTNNHT